MTKGYYSLLQYCPDFSRAEAADLGLVFLQPEPAAAAVSVVEKVGFVTKRLGLRLSTAAVSDDVQSIAHRIRYEQFRSMEDLEQFVRTRGNQIQMTMPRSMRIDEIENDADAAFAEVRSPSRSGGSNAPK